jgi:hypothetical protein
MVVLYSKCEVSDTEGAIAPVTKGELHKHFVGVLTAAHEAGVEAGSATKIPLSVVGSPKNMMASLTGGDDGGIDTRQPYFIDTHGPCGFVTIRLQAKKGDAKRLLNFLTGRVKSRYKVAALLDGLGLRADYNAYFGGVAVYVSFGDQSFMRKEDYARAFVRVLREKLDASVTADLNIYIDSRLD